MKSIALTFLLFIGLSAGAQVTKGDIDRMMSDLGTSADKITEIYIGNTMTYYKDGTSKQSYTIYNADKGNKIVFTDNGIRVNWHKDGAIKSVYFIPYKSIITYQMGVDYINVYVRKG